METPDRTFKFQPLPTSAELNTIPPATRFNSGYDSYTQPSPYEYNPHDNPDVQHEVPVFQQRYTNPDFWRSSPIFKVVESFGDGILSTAPIIFLVLAFKALAMDQQPVSDSGETVLQAARLGPTLFPIIFAAVVGRLMRTYALWRAERGSELGLLEQLNGSQNLLAAVERAFMLRGLGPTGLLVVLLWMLSPLGGQSSLRVLGTTQAHSYNSGEVYYFNTTMNSINSAFAGASSFDYLAPTMTAIYQAALLSVKQVGQQDLWQNVKIPYLEYLESYQSGTMVDGYYKDSPRRNPIYSSLTGITVAGLSKELLANFSLESSYFNMTCQTPRFFTVNLNATLPDFYGGFWEWAGDLAYHQNKSQALFSDPRSSEGDYSRSWNSLMIDTNWNYADRSVPAPSVLNLIYVSQGADVDELAAYNCSVGMAHVESRVACDGSVCSVIGMRPSLQNLQPSNVTPFTTDGIALIANFINWFPWATGAPHSAECAPTDFYIAGEDTPYQQFGKTTQYRNVSAQQVAQRFGQLLNTAWQTSLLGAATAQPPSTNVTALRLGTDGGTGYDSIKATTTTTLATNVYTANRSWIALTAVIAIILLFCGVAGMSFKYLSSAPDILGYVSTMTRDNPYFQGPPGGNNVDGLERARLLRHVQVQIADVKPWEERGHIALRNLGTEGERLRHRGRSQGRVSA